MSRRSASRIWTKILEFGQCDPMPLKLFVERASRYSQPLGSSFHAASLFLEYPFDVLAFKFNQGEIGTRVDGLRSSPVKVKVFQPDGLLVAEQHSSFNYIP